MRIDREKVDLILAEKLMTTQDMAENIGISVQCVRQNLNRQNVRPTTAGRVAKALGVDVTEILKDGE